MFSLPQCHFYEMWKLRILPTAQNFPFHNEIMMSKLVPILSINKVSYSIPVNFPIFAGNKYSESETDQKPMCPTCTHWQFASICFRPNQINVLVDGISEENRVM